MKKYILILIFVVVLFSGCNRPLEKKEQCSVVLEMCQDVIPDRQSADINRGDNVSFVLSLKNGCVIEGTDYDNYEISREHDKTVLTLKNVCYSTVVKLNTAYCYRAYFPNGGAGEEIRESLDDEVRNTRIVPFTREGYIQTGWNTKADGSGKHIGFGSRTTYDKLYAHWEKETEETAFLYVCTEDSAIITGYRGTDEKCVLPDTLGGKKVRRIKRGSFAEASFREFVCSDTVQTIEAGAFENAKVEILTLYDNLVQVSDESFRGCPIKTLHLNARRNPVYAGSYFSAFPDKCERLFSLEREKIVLFSGSSGRYGYCSEMIERAFTEYDVVNMGTYAYTNATPQLDIVRQAMNSGDILVEAPEFDAAAQQFCESREIDRFFFSLVETNYDLIAFLDLQKYTNVFDALNEYLYEHGRMKEKDYSELASDYDDDGNRIDYPTYNKYGDYILVRPNSKYDEMHRIIPADYTTDTITKKRIENLDRELALFTEKGINVLFTYAPRNRNSLTEKSTKEKMNEVEVLLHTTLSVPVISKIEESLYSGIYFYEIDNHLSDEGAILRTEQFIRDMKKWMTER